MVLMYGIGVDTDGDDYDGVGADTVDTDDTFQRTGLLRMLDVECSVRGCPETYVQKVGTIINVLVAVFVITTTTIIMYRRWPTTLLFHGPPCCNLLTLTLIQPFSAPYF